MKLPTPPPAFPVQLSDSFLDMAQCSTSISDLLMLDLSLLALFLRPTSSSRSMTICKCSSRVLENTTMSSWYTDTKSETWIEWSDSFLHQTLKNSWGICQTKPHDAEFEKFLLRHKRRLFPRIRVQVDLPESCSQIDGSTLPPPENARFWAVESSPLL